MTTEVARAIEAARRLAARLDESASALAPLRPLDAAAIEGLDAATAERTDAFLKRFENLVVHLQEQLWRLVVVAEGEVPSAMSRRDIVELMDRLGLVPSAAAARNAIAIRNRLAHGYPLNAGLSAARLEDALTATPLLLDCVARAQAYLSDQLPG